MKTKLWIIRMWECVEPEVHGPYTTEASRLKAARQLKGPEHAIMRIDSVYQPFIAPFTNNEVGE